MFDLGLTKLAVIGVVALVVVGPERLPRVARTMGALFGRAQRYVNEIKTEVTREIEIEEWQQIHTHFKQTAQDIESVMHEADYFSSAALNPRGQSPTTLSERAHHSSLPAWALGIAAKRRWHTKYAGLPLWYKQITAKRRYLQSGAARVARHRPVRLHQPIRFF